MCEQTRADFARKFRKPGPTRLAIKNLVNRFQRTGSVADEERPGRPDVPPDTVQNVHYTITLSPSASTRRLSRELGIPQITVWTTLRYKFHIQVKINSIEQLKQRIRAAAAKITPATLAKVFRSVVERWSLCLDHGWANHATEGGTLQFPIHCCDVTNPPYLFSGELCTSTLHCKRLLV